MYNPQGLGDCFLLAFRAKDNTARYVLIDFGVHQSTADPQGKLQPIAEDIARVTHNHLDLVVLTHEHADHLSGFYHAQAAFSDIEIDELWLAWPEDPDDPLAQELLHEYGMKLRALESIVTQFKAGEPSLRAFQELLAYEFGSPQLGAAGQTAPLEFLREKSKSTPPPYRRPGEPALALPGVEGVRFYVLGPPRDKDLIKRSRPRKGEVYDEPFTLDEQIAFSLAALAASEEADLDEDEQELYDQSLPFDKSYHIKLDEAAEHPEHGEFFIAKYGFGRKKKKHGDKWRRIDVDWLTTAEQLAIDIDHHRNNTSLVLAIELVESGRVLLFVGDAQVGNWLSWPEIEWQDEDGTVLKGEHLLQRTVLYKVGHHGSHNATLRDQGLELMQSPELVAMLPVDEEWAHGRRPYPWKMPFGPLLERLEEKTKGRILRTDTGVPPERPDLLSPAEWQAFQNSVRVGPDQLWVQYSMGEGPPPASGPAWETPREALTHPVFDALTVLLADPLDVEPGAYLKEVLEAAVAEVLGAGADDWQIEPVNEYAAGAFDLIPPPGLSISVPQGFQLKYLLAEQEHIVYASALFETLLDNTPEESEIGMEMDRPMSFALGANWWDKLTVAEQDPQWGLRMIDAEGAWQFASGVGIVVGHPDSGYIPHPEMDESRILHSFERDFYEGDVDAHNPVRRGGNHGLATASVIMSGPQKLTDRYFVTGVAPGAQIIPLRITKKGAPVFFFRSGPRRVRDAIYHAIDSGCHVISMSLGGVGEESFHRALQEAVRQNIIVLAAAGNYVRFVVWPARYPETIAVAACTAGRERWFHSSRGPTVDVTAPGHNVWRACMDESGIPVARPSSGTSYAVAMAAGAASLWLAHHGRDNLLQKYPGVPLQEVFRGVMAASCDPPPENDHENFGSGILNARRLLETPLPPLEEFLPDPHAMGMAADVQPAETGARKIAQVFDTISEDRVYTRLSAMTGRPKGQLDALLEGLEDELLFHIVTNPELRGSFAVVDETTPTFEGPALTGLPMDAEDVATGPALRKRLLAVPGLSDNLRQRIAP
jgi:subtilisin family serine protease